MVNISSQVRMVFPDARVSSGYIRIRCPYHKDGHEHKPSMSILTERRGNAPAGFCHCFACGKVVTLEQLFKDVNAGIEPDLAESRDFDKDNIRLTTEQVMFKQQLPFRLSNYLLSRGIGEQVQRKFRVYEKDGKVHMPVFDRDGIYMYDNARSTKGKWFFVDGASTKTLWGIEEIDFSKPIVVCESQIDAMSFWQVNMQAVATLGADNIRSLSEIRKATDLIILAFDPDEAGRRARDRAASMLGKFRCRWLDLPEGVDVNQALQDMKDERVFKNFMRRCLKPFVQ